MLCDKCKKNPATVHMQQFIMGKKAELRLCQECVFSFSVPDVPIELENMFKGFLEQMQTKVFNINPQMANVMPGFACTNCGMTGEELKAGGKLGCRECYASFAGEVGAILKSVQSSTRHIGKFPKRTGKEILSIRHASDLRAKLNQAIAEENFELAAKLRDEIRALEVS